MTSMMSIVSSLSMQSFDWSWNTTWYLKSVAKNTVLLRKKKAFVGRIIRFTYRWSFAPFLGNFYLLAFWTLWILIKKILIKKRIVTEFCCKSIWFALNLVSACAVRGEVQEKRKMAKSAATNTNKMLTVLKFSLIVSNN